MPESVELLSPAKDSSTAIEAIKHGADAVYIGGPAFGARSAAGNSVDDIESVCRFAHLFNAKVYVTLNTILWDSELEQARTIIWQLYDAGVDALIIQDFSILEMDLPPIALHASTQMDNRTPGQAKMLEKAGFSQIVLARELSLETIKDIHASVSVPLEAFVHGALCVSYSGKCYASQYCFGRSANRGCCAQFCRLSFDLVNKDGEIISRDKHLLSLKDMNRSASLEEMLDAGIRSFKIEGRLKDTSYVKNVTAYYRNKLDEILKRRKSDYIRSSYGYSELTFSPDPARSFNRGFTNYFLKGREINITNFATPKAMGKLVGIVSNVERGAISLSKQQDHISAGDGLCFIDNDGKLQGFRANKVIGSRIIPGAPNLFVRKGQKIYRNLDHNFEKSLQKPSAVRKLGVDIDFEETPTGYRLQLSNIGNDVKAETLIEIAHEPARSPQRENISRQLTKLGDSIFVCKEININISGERFIQSALLNEARRKCVETLEKNILSSYKREVRKQPLEIDEVDGQNEFAEKQDYSANIANKEAEKFYKSHGAKSTVPAFELQQPEHATLMTCKYCLRYAFGKCPKQSNNESRNIPQWKEPVALRLPDGRTFPLKFDCCKCEMRVYAPDK